MKLGLRVLRMRMIFFGAIAALAFCWPAIDAWALDGDFFERKIRPMFLERCGKCHGGNETKAGLTLTTVDGILKGGESGSLIARGNPTGSLLIRVVRHTGKLKMPPKNPLPDAEIVDLVNWVKSGAKLPDSRSLSKKRSHPKNGGGYTKNEQDHWAFLPIAGQIPPVLADSPWPRNGLDSFVLDRQRKQGLLPGSEATRRTLLRRAAFDLLGLPPSRDALARYLSDDSPDAFSREIDRLLASPRYGERWGRHWLDVVRYADTNGGGFDYVYPNAWKYRDYVIRSFNEDKPFDRFVLEQIAGDLLPPCEDRHEHLDRLKATGFLTLASKGLGEQDKEKMVMDVVEDQIDVLGRSLMGLTLACARCHDHKFDPISIQDYYGLAGIFRSTVTIVDVDKNPSYWPERPLEAPEDKEAREAHRDLVKANGRAIENAREEARRAVVQNARMKLDDYLWAALRIMRLPPPVDVVLSPGKLSAVEELESLLDVEGNDDDDSRTLGNPDEASKPYDVAMAEKEGFVPTFLHNFIEILRQAISKADSPFREIVSGRVRSPEDLRSISKKCREALDELLDDAEKTPFALGEDAESLYSSEDKRRIDELIARKKRIEEEKPPPSPTAMIAYDHNESVDLRVHLAGNHRNLGEVVERRFPRVLTRGKSFEMSRNQSGRLDLARWLTDPRHPLTARVFVNRVWQGHFGQGIVRTPDNFGSLGELPSHPELLDWLAQTFMEDQWSIKALHRRIMLSSTYRQSVANGSGSASVDSGNRFLSRKKRLRLEAEPLRDAILSISGQLDLAEFGTVQDWKPKLFSVNDKNEETANYETKRRSIYLPVVRDSLNDFLALFDFGDPNSVTAQRTPTTVSLQSLFLINNPWMTEQARHFAERLLHGREKTTDERIDQAYELCFARLPTSSEKKRARDFLSSFESSEKHSEEVGSADHALAWSQFCHALFAMNEFLFVD